MRQRGQRSAQRPTSDLPVPIPAEIDSLVRQGDTDAASKLQELAAGENRDFAKAARRALYLLRQKGIEPPPRQDAAPASRIPAPASQAYLTQVGGTGSRMALFVRDDPYGGSPTLITLLLNDLKGVVDIGHRRMPRKQIEQTLAKLGSKEGRELAEVPVDYGRYVVQEAIAQNAERRTSIPPGVGEMQRLIGLPEETYPNHPVYNRIDSAKLANDLSVSRAPEKFLERSALRGWVLDIEDLLPWHGKAQEAQKSPIVLNESAQAQRYDKIVDDATDSLIGVAGIGLWKRRLEDTAFVLDLAGQTEAAREALYHAVSLSESMAPHRQVFLRAVVRRSFDVLQALEHAQQEKEASTGLIERI